MRSKLFFGALTSFLMACVIVLCFAVVARPMVHSAQHGAAHWHGTEVATHSHVHDWDKHLMAHSIHQYEDSGEES